MMKVDPFAPAFGLPNASPFCMELETWLRMAGLPFELVNDGMRLVKAPKKSCRTSTTTALSSPTRA
jgi:hypothetical protein